MSIMMLLIFIFLVFLFAASTLISGVLLFIWIDSMYNGKILDRPSSQWRTWFLLSIFFDALLVGVSALIARGFI